MKRLVLIVAALTLVTAAPTTDARATTCAKPTGVQTTTFSKSKYPNIYAHVKAAIRKGWPRTLVVNRPHADERRNRLLADVPTKDGYDRDEYPPAEARGRGKGLMRGRHPTGWKADVRYVPSSENRSQGASLGDQLRPFCNGTRFRYAWK